MTTTAVSELLPQRGSLNHWSPDYRLRTEHAALVEKVNAEAREHWGIPDWHRQVAADIAQTLEYGFLFQNYFGDYIEVQQVGKFDRLPVRLVKGLKVFYTARGGYIDESDINTELWEVPRDTMGFHVSEHVDKLQANFAMQMADLVSMAEMRMNAEVWRRMFSLLQSAIPQNSPYYHGTSGLSKPEVDQALREVRDAIKPNNLAPTPTTIIGRAAMIDQISDFNLGFDPEATEEIRARGRLGVYRAANVVQVFNFTDEDGASFIPANELWVFGGRVGLFGLFGALEFKQWQENTIDVFHSRGRKDLGGTILFPDQARRLVDTSISP
jgi:hypothetical protein